MQLNAVVCQNHRLVALFVAEDFGHMVKLIASQRDGVAVDITGVYKKSAYFHKCDFLFWLYAFFSFRARQSSLSALSMMT